DSTAAAVRFEIPGDIDHLSRNDPAAANAWRVEMRRVVGALIDTADATRGARPDDPVQTVVSKTEGDYTITGFASSKNAEGGRKNEYILTRRRGNAGKDPT
ncbi:MAG: hypothetical protein ACR2J8_12525, partial [Thermomicrobiales bacterium]